MKFGAGASSNQYRLYKNYLLSALYFMEDKTEGTLSKLKKTKESYLEVIKPVLLDASPESDDMKIQKEHELMKINLQRHGVSDPDTITALAFFSLVEEMDKVEVEREKKNRNKR